MLVADQTKTESRQEKIVRWYLDVLPAASKFVQRRGGDMDIARELFQEAIVRYYEKLMSVGFTPLVSDEAYLMGIVKKLWFRHCEQAGTQSNLDSIEISEENPQQVLTQKLLKYLQNSGKRCMELLQSFYYENLNMKQMGQRFGYTSERSATVGKYKCLEKVRESIKQKSLSYEDFVD